MSLYKGYWQAEARQRTCLQMIEDNGKFLEVAKVKNEAGSPNAYRLLISIQFYLNLFLIVNVKKLLHSLKMFIRTVFLTFTSECHKENIKFTSFIG